MFEEKTGQHNGQGKCLYNAYKVISRTALRSQALHEASLMAKTYVTAPSHSQIHKPDALLIHLPACLIKMI